VPSGRAFQRVLDALGSAGLHPRGHGRQMSARCPAHDDSSPSLSITDGTERVLVKCHAGCDTDDVLAALHLTRADLFDEARSSNEDWTPCGHGIAAEYRYDDDTGRHLFTVVRCPVKHFAQWRPDPTAKSGRRWSLGDVQRVPYRLPRLLEGIGYQHVIYITEGEKDADRLTALGEYATCNPHGAGKWRDEYVPYFKDAAVIVIADVDSADKGYAGQRHAEHVAASLHTVAASVVILQAAAGKDVSEHLDAGYALEDLVDYVRPPDVEAEPDSPVEPIDRIRAALVDSAGLERLPQPEPLIHGVLQRDSLAWLVGKPGHAKTLVALDMAGSIGTGQSWQGMRTNQGPVLYIIAEGVHGIRDRVRAWEYLNGQDMVGVQFLPMAVQVTNGAYWGALCELAQHLRPGLIVVDTQPRVTVGLEENSSKDMGLFVNELEKLRSASGACVLTIQHTPRNADHIRGSSAIDGAATTIIFARKDDEIVSISNDQSEGGKQKDMETFATIHLRLIPTRLSTGNSVGLGLSDGGSSPTDISTKARDLVQKWIGLFANEWISVKDVEETLSVPKSTFYHWRPSLYRAGIIRNNGKSGGAARYQAVHDLDGRPVQSQSNSPTAVQPELPITEPVQSNSPTPL
jgi:hypothetical protein